VMPPAGLIVQQSPRIWLTRCDVGLSANECRAIGAIHSRRVQFQTVNVVARTIGAGRGNVQPSTEVS